MKIYTKTGDKGETSLIGGERVKKDSTRVKSYGTMDEVSSMIGVAITYVENQEIKNLLLDVQKDLFVMMSELACSRENTHKLKNFIGNSEVENLEKNIDYYKEISEKFKLFEVKEKGRAAAYLNLARATIRRGEREIVALIMEGVSEHILKYVNRLSDLLFILTKIKDL